jgi:hypothetical protein
MLEPVRHRQTKGAATDMFVLPPPRHTPTLPQQIRCLKILPTTKDSVSHDRIVELKKSDSLKVVLQTICYLITSKIYGRPRAIGCEGQIVEIQILPQHPENRIALAPARDRVAKPFP